jgi:peptidoglycan/xylan/chitin deacetylase (PgdA/CDA1 family)
VHVVTLSFDDGFECSSIRTAEIFERHGLVAELNVVAAGHRGKPDEMWHNKWRKGDFGLWNELEARGHHVMPHGYGHVNKAEVPLVEAKRLIEACLEVFRAELAGSRRRRQALRFRTTSRLPRSRPGWVVAFAPSERAAIP